MVNSMTGFAALETASDGLSRSWEVRSVNGRGLDIRLRLPDRLGRLEIPIREKIKAKFARGNVSVSLRVSRDSAQGGMVVNPDTLASNIEVLKQIEDSALAQGLHITPVTPANILSMPGVIGDAAQAQTLPEDSVFLAEFDLILADFEASRAQEGQALQDVLSGQIAQMAPLVEAAATYAAARSETAAARLKRNIDAVLEATDTIDPDRLAQELAMLAVKTDITEEIDRLANAHIPAAQALLTAEGPVGRRFDFLMQEFNREANTLCSKSQDADLTQAGLDLKVLIDQMREQVQNVE